MPGAASAEWAVADGQADASDREDARRLDQYKVRILEDLAWRNRLTVARGVYGRHPLELEGGSDEDIHLLDFVALALTEQDAVKRT